MDRKLYASVLEELDRAAGQVETGILRGFYGALDHLVRSKRKRFARVLPLGEYLVDRWDKARALGFGEGTSVYDSCIVIGDVRVGARCWIGPFTILDGSGGLTIGDGCTISAGAHIYTHDNVAQTLDGAPIERAPTTIGRHVYLGPHSVVARGVTIGDRVVVGAGSVVLSDIAAGSKVVGERARIVGAT